MISQDLVSVYIYTALSHARSGPGRYIAVAQQQQRCVLWCGCNPAALSSSEQQQRYMGLAAAAAAMVAAAMHTGFQRHSTACVMVSMRCGGLGRVEGWVGQLGHAASSGLARQYL